MEIEIKCDLTCKDIRDIREINTSISLYNSQRAEPDKDEAQVNRHKALFQLIHYIGIHCTGEVEGVKIGQDDVDGMLNLSDPVILQIAEGMTGLVEEEAKKLEAASTTSCVVVGAAG